MDENMRSIPKEKLRFATKRDLSHDSRFETKPVSYFQGAFNRFCKNKGAVVGGMILSAPQTRKVVYVVNGQEVELQVDKDKTLAEIQKPVIEGYDFEGWYSDSELTNKLDNNFVFVEDAVIYPKFVPKNCQVEYYANYGTGDVFFQEVVFKSEYKLMENKFERENYVFVGWSIDPNSHYDDENVVKQNKRETLLTEGVKYYAIWKGENRKITFSTPELRVNGEAYKFTKTTCPYGEKWAWELTFVELPQRNWCRTDLMCLES